MDIHVTVICTHVFEQAGDSIRDLARYRGLGDEYNRENKNSKVTCFLVFGGSISFARRFLLFHHGVAFPRNDLHYYRHHFSPYSGGSEPEAASGGGARFGA
ncbi:DUF2890 domain-containing protein [Haemophilus influenzae]|nr:DUF2890 domain-containing protein [Haemophilus influenzae]